LSGGASMGITRAGKSTERGHRATPTTARSSVTPRRARIPADSLPGPAPQAVIHRCACGGTCPRCRPAGGTGDGIPVSQPGDQAEREAERIANAVAGAGSRIGRETTSPLRRTAGADQAGAPVELAQRATVEASLRSGRPLPEPTRASLEKRFGADFSAVRIHTGPQAASAARSLQARAFTLGHDVAFGRGEYRPETAAGRRLLAHELTHVLQQQRSTTSAVQGGAHMVQQRETGPRVQRQESDESSDGEAPPSGRIPAYIFVYATDDPQLVSSWRASAEFFARTHDGFALEAGSNAADTLTRIVDAYDPARYSCIRAIEFFGHGSAGETLSGAFTASDLPTAEDLAAAAGARAAREVTETAGGEPLPDEGDFADFVLQFRDLLCGPSYFHFRSCQSLRDTAGTQFGEAAARTFQTHVIGHTEYIDTLLPGERVFGPGGDELSAAPPELIAPRPEVSDLPFRHFRLRVDLSDQDVLRHLKREVVLAAEVHPNPADPLTYLLRLNFLYPEVVEVREIATLLAGLAPGSDISPTVEAIESYVAGSTGGAHIDVPVDYRIIQRFTENNRTLSFQLPAALPGGDVDIGVEFTAVGRPPSHIERVGGLPFAIDMGVINATDPGSGLFLRPHLTYPLFQYRTLLQANLQIGSLVGQGTFAGDVRIPIRFQPYPTDITPYFSVAPVLGYGTYMEETGFAAGAGVAGGLRVGRFEGGLAADFLKTPHRGVTNMFFLQVGWVFR